MRREQRRAKILEILDRAGAPVTGTELAETLGVTRQVIVQELAILRTTNNILSTHTGYFLLKEKPVASRVFKVRHATDMTEQELTEIVDLGGKVEDVFIYHRVYGVVRGQLEISSRADVQDFMQRLRESSSGPLMQVTDDFHYHTVSAPRQEVLDRIEKRLGELGLLAPLTEYEPEELEK